MKIERKIAIPDFYGKGRHIYDDEMGFNAQIRDEVRSNVMREIFLEALGQWHYEMCIYYSVNQTFYFFAMMEKPLQVLILPRDLNESEYIRWQCNETAYEFGTVIATYETAEEIWENFRIDGKRLEEVIPLSFVLHFT